MVLAIVRFLEVRFVERSVQLQLRDHDLVAAFVTLVQLHEAFEHVTGIGLQQEQLRYDSFVVAFINVVQLQPEPLSARLENVKLTVLLE